MNSEERSDQDEGSANFAVRGLDSEVLLRLKEAVRTAGGNRTVAKLSGVPLSTLNSALSGISDPRSSAVAAIARATGRSLNWILMGVGPETLPRPSEAGSMQAGDELVPASPIDVQALAAVVSLVEGWLASNRRVLSPEKKGEIVAAIYQIVMEDAAVGQKQIDTRKVNQFLRLVS